MEDKKIQKSQAQKNQPAAAKSKGIQKMVMQKENYYLILAGVVIIIIGFMLMSGGHWTDPHVFPANEIYSTRRITVAPIVVILGFIIEVYAVFHKPKKAN